MRKILKVPFFLGLILSLPVSAGDSEESLPVITTRELWTNDYNQKSVRIVGQVIDQFVDEVDPMFLYLIIKDSFGTAYASAASWIHPEIATNDLIGCVVSLEGKVQTSQWKPSRKHIYHELQIRKGERVTILKPSSDNPFSAPVIDDIPEIPPALYQNLGPRKLKGKVCVTRHGDEFLLRTRQGHIARIELRDKTPPKIGACVEAVGHVETDIHHLNLSRAVWRTTDDLGIEDAPETSITARGLLTADDGQTQIRVSLHGHPVRIRAVVRSLPDPDYSDRVIFAESDGMTFPIDAGNCPEVFAKLGIGSTVEATGICWMEIENWRPNAVFPKVKGFTLVLRTADDITVIARPSWWTPARLLTVIGALLAALLGFVIWNRALQKLAERRGRQLFREQATRMAAELKTAERSRLAVELHDSISQVLTGVALKIKASQSQVRTAPDKALSNLNIAESTLRSSREELRYCLWDLRNNILDLPNLEEAIRQTLRPQIGDIELTVRFPVSHRRLSDNTVHIVLQIVRELAVNAIRHGEATAIRIAGTLDQGVLAFSVQDNGIGFDPDSAPGPEQGHFGLLGVRDRLAHYDGTIEIQSTPGKGTRAIVRMIIADDKEP